ncbi:MAG: hypothetical protein QM831_14575 [Kofleriaceae bacterium]
MTDYVTPAAKKVAGEDPVAFEDIVSGVAAVMARKEDYRFQQQAVPVSGTALEGRPVAMRAILAGALQLAELDVEPGWFVQLLVRPLAVCNDEQFVTLWRGCVELASSMARAGQWPGYPIATGLAALIAREDRAALPSWLEVLTPIARAAKDNVYGLFEYGLVGLAQGGLSAEDVTEALTLALSMLDHGLWPGQTLMGLSSEIQLDIASRLAKAGVDPHLVITNGVSYFQELGLLEDGGDRLVKLAVEMHRRGLRQLLWDDGLNILPALERDHAGLAARSVDLMEKMVEKDLEPAIIFRWCIPRTWGFMRPAWSAVEMIGFAEMLVDRGIAPEPAITHAARPLSELATDAEDFRRLAASVTRLVASLAASGEALFRDVAELASAGGESQTFRELLEAFQQLIDAWGTADSHALLEQAIPAAAREASGKPWMLAQALQHATKLVKDDRRAEAVTLLEVGVRTIAQLGADGFAANLVAIEKAYAALPAALANHASLAAGVLAGTDLARLEAALHVIAKRDVGALAPALPDLARMAKDADSFGRLIDEALQLPHAIAVAHLAAQACRHDPDAGAAAMKALAAWATDSAKVARIEGAGVVGRYTPGAELAPTIAMLHEAMEGVADKKALWGFVEHARSAATLKKMCAVIAPLVKDRESLLVAGLYRAHELVARSPHAWTYLVQPALVTAKQHAGPLLAELSWRLPRYVEDERDAEVLRDLITQRGVRAVDLISNLVLPALTRNVMPGLAEHRELLDRYLREVGFADAEVYREYIAVHDEPAKVAALKATVLGLTTGIRAGEVTPEQRAHPLFAVALQYVFPSGVTATRDLYIAMVEGMPDRPADVRAYWPNGHDAPLQVSAGSYQLIEGEHDLSAFGWRALVEPGERETMPVLGWKLITAWSEGRLGRERHDHARALLAHAEAIPGTATDSAAQLLAIRALAGDRLSALVEEAVVAARAEDNDRVDRLVQARLAPAPRIGAGLVKQLTKMLDQVRAGTLAKDVAEKRVRGLLNAFELPDDPIAFLLGDAVTALKPKVVQIEPGKELGRIHADLVGQELAAMTETIGRVLEYRASSATIAIDCSITKRQVHSPIGLTMGVCVARDLELWNQPHFMHLALWADGVCQGGVHLLVLEEAGKRYLALPGINPTFALMDRIEAAELVRALLDRTKQLAREAGCAAVWIPTAAGIHSNRWTIHDALVALKLPERSTHGHPFSYSPYAYRISGVWELEV